MVRPKIEIYFATGALGSVSKTLGKWVDELGIKIKTEVYFYKKLLYWEREGF